MAREKKSSNRVYILMAVGVLLVIAAYALWQGKRDVPESTTANQSTVQEAPSTPEEAKIPAESQSQPGTAETKPQPSPDKPRPSFISQEGLASIPADRFFTTAAMNGLTPGAPAAQFTTGDAVYIYAGIHAPKAERIQLQWYGPDGNLILPSIYKNISANTGAVGYRIYTYRIFRDPGQYQVKLYNSAGTVIGQTSFEVVD